MAVVLSDLLEEGRVTLELHAQTRDEALREIVATMCKTVEVCEEEKFLAEVIARENVHTTFMGHGIAFPHARTEWVEQIVLGLGRSRAGIAFGAEGELAHLIFVIGVPKRMVTDYLVCVGALARMTKEEATRTALLEASSAADLLQILREGSLRLE
ncbi:MAG: PTS sugar transporter subunit IIA [Chthoniobacterales bacterium]